MRSPTVLITGATGFIGSHLTRNLISQSWDVHILVRRSSDTNKLREYLEDESKIHFMDNSAKSIMDAVRSSKPTVVFHLASCFLAQHSYVDIPALIESNLLFGTQLVDAMTSCGCTRLVNTGTSWQHFQNSQYNPVCLYAATKQAFESILEYYREGAGLQTITLSLFDTYGPDDARPKLLNFLKHAAIEQTFLAMSPGEQMLDMVHIDDVVNAFFQAALHLLSKGCTIRGEYAVSSGTPIRLKDLATLFMKSTGRTVNIEWGGRSYRTREVMVPWNLGRRLPGWSPQIGLEQGLRSVFGSISNEINNAMNTLHPE